jgi:hypothetical protein
MRLARGSYLDLGDYASVINVLDRARVSAAFRHFRHVDVDLVCPDTPHRLSVAPALAFPDGSVITSGLRREGARSSLLVGLQESKRILRRRMRFPTPAPAWVS